jgi:hypothetical protein
VTCRHAFTGGDRKKGRCTTHVTLRRGRKLHNNIGKATPSVSEHDRRERDEAA